MSQKSPIYRIEHIKENKRDLFEISPFIKMGVYREIENLSSKSEILANMFEKHNNSYKFPCGYDDFKYAFHYNNDGIRVISIYGIDISFKNFFFGFSSLEEVNNWFTVNELKELKKHGYVLKKFVDYENVIIGESNKQIIFMPKNIGVIVWEIVK